MHDIINTQEPTPRLIRPKQLLAEWDAEAQALYEAQKAGLNRGPITGLGRLDAELAGGFAPGIHILHGSPGTGKTALSLQIACTCQCPALFVTCEMSPLELLRRVTARATGTYLGRLKTGELSPDESGRLVRQAIAETPFLAFLDSTQALATMQHIANGALAARQLDPECRHHLIVIDSLHSWADRAITDGTEYDRLNMAIDSLRQLAIHLNCPILCIAERNRASMSSGGLSAGAGTRKIEYAAETVIDLEADKDRAEDARGNMQVTLSLPKNRHGAPGKSMKLLFHGATQRFSETR